MPASCLVQCQHNIAVTGAERCYLAVLIGDLKLLIKDIARDEELVYLIISAEIEFWTEHVEKKIPPRLDGSTVAEMYIKERFPKSDSVLKVNLKEEYKESIAKYLSLKKSIRTMEEEAKMLENNIKLEMGEAERGILGNFLVVWKSVYSNRIDSKILKERYPEIYKDVCRETASRRFEIRMMN